jgi:hypothetical protein
MKRSDFGACRAERLGASKFRLIDDWRTPYGTIPKYFKSDGVTTGNMPFLASPSGGFFEAAILHDWMYENAYRTKAFADTAFYRTALLYGVHPVRAWLAYQLVKFKGKGKYERK